MALMNRRKAWTLFVLLIIVVVGCLLYFSSHKKTHEIKATVAVTMPTVSIIPLAYHVIPQSVTSYGTTISPLSVNLTAPTSGIISTIDFAAGQKVKQGQLLFTIKSNDVNNQPAKLKAVMLTDKSKFDLLQKVQQQVPGAIAKQDLLAAKLLYQQDLAAYSAALELQRIIAPISGTVSATNLAVGSVVNLGDALAYLHDSASLRVTYQLPNQYSEQLHLGQPINFYPNDSSKHYVGSVTYISPSLRTMLLQYNISMRAAL